MSKKVAVMDLGTNTFHLLIAEGDAANPVILFKTTDPVKLGEGGINKGLIQPEAYKRGIIAMQKFREYILKYNVNEIRAIATSALRTAANGKDFIDEVKADTGIAIETIEGAEEAEYIYLGVKAGGSLSQQKSLILDIGGGSVEFIIADKSKIFWKKSFEIGAARLMDKFHQVDPIQPESINQLNNYLAEQLGGFFVAANKYHLTNLIGSSGAFETFAGLTETAKGNTIDLKKIKDYKFTEANFLAVTDQLIASSHQDRADNKCIIPVRVDMIVSSALITRYIMHKLNLPNVMMCVNSLKEGVLASMLGQ